MASGGDKTNVPTFLNPPVPPEGGNVNPQQTNIYKNGKTTQKPSTNQEEGKPPQDQGTKI